MIKEEYNIVKNIHPFPTPRNEKQVIRQFKKTFL